MTTAEDSGPVPATAAALGVDGDVVLNGKKGKIIFEPATKDSLPAARQALLDRLDKAESGDVGRPEKKRLKRFLGGVSKVLDFMMHNRKFQICTGLVGIGVFVAVGCVVPFAFIGVVPALIIFAHGMSDGLDSFLPSPQPLPANNDPSAGKASPDPITGQDKRTKGSSTQNPAPVHTEQGTQTGAPELPGNLSSPTTDRNLKKERDAERKQVEDAAEELRRQLKKERVDAQADVVAAPVTNEAIQNVLQSTFSQRQEPTPEPFDLDSYLSSDACFGEQSELVNTLGREKANQLQYSLQLAISTLKAEYKLNDTGPFVEDDRYIQEGFQTPPQKEWVIVRDAIMKNCVDQLVNYARTNGQLPSTRQEKKESRMTPAYIMARATQAAGLPFDARSQQQTSLCSAVYMDAVNLWYNTKVGPDKREQSQPLAMRSR